MPCTMPWDMRDEREALYDDTRGGIIVNIMSRHGKCAHVACRVWHTMWVLCDMAWHAVCHRDKRDPAYHCYDLDFNLRTRPISHNPGYCNARAHRLGCRPILATCTQMFLWSIRHCGQCRCWCCRLLLLSWGWGSLLVHIACCIKACTHVYSLAGILMFPEACDVYLIFSWHVL